MRALLAGALLVAALGTGVSAAGGRRGGGGLEPGLESVNASSPPPLANVESVGVPNVDRLRRNISATTHQELLRRNWLMGFPPNGTIRGKFWRLERPELLAPEFRADDVISAVRLESLASRVRLSRDTAADLLAKARQRVSSSREAAGTLIYAPKVRSLGAELQHFAVGIEKDLDRARDRLNEAVRLAREVGGHGGGLPAARRIEELQIASLSSLRNASDALITASGRMAEGAKLGWRHGPVSSGFMAASRALARAADVALFRWGFHKSERVWEDADQAWRRAMERYRLDKEAEQRRKKLEEELCKRKKEGIEEVKKRSERERARLREQLYKQIKREEEIAAKRKEEQVKKAKEKEMEAALKSLKEEEEKRRAEGRDALRSNARAAYSDSWDACHNTLCKGFLSDLSESGCLYGCSGVLEGALEEGLEQVRRRDDCKEYCRGLLEERDSISELKHVQPSLKTNAQWVGGCLDGCLAGYARKAAKHGARAVDGDSDGSGSAGGCAGVKNLAGDRSVLSCS